MKKKLITETAWHHQGEEPFMFELVGALCSSRTDCVKVHLLMDIDEYMHHDHQLYDTLKGWMLSQKLWEKVFGTIKAAGKELLALCNDRKSIDFALENGASGLELHAATAHDLYLLGHLMDKVKGSDTKIFIGVGALPLEEVDALYQKELNMVMMFGVQNYPTKPENLVLARQKRLMQLFPKADFGYADHTEWNHPDNLLLTLMGGMDKTYIEKHVTIKPGEKRLDYESAISINQMNRLRDWLDLAEQVEGSGELLKNWGEAQYGKIGPMRKGMMAARNFASGEPFDMDSIVFKRTSQNSDLLPCMLGNGGYTFTRNVKSGEIVTSTMLKLKD